MFKKKRFVITAMVLVVCLAVFLNWQYKAFDMPETQDTASLVDADVPYEADKILGEAKLVSTGTDDSVEVSAYFENARLTRQSSRDESVELLQKVVENSSSSQEEKDKATADISNIAAGITSEGNIENLVTAKGFAAALAIVSDETATVMVQTNGLLANEVAQINEIVQQETGLSAKDIKVVEIN